MKRVHTSSMHAGDLTATLACDALNPVYSASLQVYLFAPAPGGQTKPGTVDEWFESMQDDWEAPTEFVAVRKTTRGGGAAALLALRKSRRSGADAAPQEKSESPPRPSRPKPSVGPSMGGGGRSKPSLGPSMGGGGAAARATTSPISRLEQKPSYEDSEIGGPPPPRPPRYEDTDISLSRGRSKRPDGAPPLKPFVVPDGATFNDLVHPSTLMRRDAEALLEARRAKIGRGASGLFLVRASSKERGAIVISM